MFLIVQQGTLIKWISLDDCIPEQTAENDAFSF